MKNVAGSGGRWLDVPAERLPRWIGSFMERHQSPAAPVPALAGVTGPGLLVALAGDRVTFTAPDGAVAECHPPFAESLPLLTALPVPGGRPGPGPAPGPDAPAAFAVTADEAVAAITAHATAPRTVGVLLVRLGGYAAGVFTGYPPQLADAKVGARPVHGRSAAGGWSQQRFARRREKQASEALQAAADAAFGVFGRSPRLDAVVVGGDKRAVAELRDDPRLARYFAIATDRVLTVPDPKRAVLAASPRLFLAVRIWLTEPDRSMPGPPSSQHGHRDT